MTIRELTRDDLPFLREMLYTALDWRPGGVLPPRELVLQHTQVVVFHEGWGREGDAGFVAEADGEPVGAAWWRVFTEEAHGEGFVDEETPELAVAVADGHRGRGIGLALMSALHEHGRRTGVARVSLSVEPENPAKRLYERLGYVDHQPADGLGRMTLDLATP